MAGSKRCRCEGKGCYKCVWGLNERNREGNRRTSYLDIKGQSNLSDSNRGLRKDKPFSGFNQRPGRDSASQEKRRHTISSSTVKREKVHTRSVSNTPGPRTSPGGSSLLLLLNRDGPKSPSSSPPCDPPKHSTLTSKYDKEMAKRQTSIRALSPAERKKQEDWAIGQLKKNESSNCPFGLIWVRDEGTKCHRCLGGAHEVTDELLAEGKGGYYYIYRTQGQDIRSGPWYGEDPRWVGMSEEQKRKFRFQMFGTDNPKPGMKPRIIR